MTGRAFRFVVVTTLFTTAPLASSACGSSPDPNYYALSPSPEAQSTGPRASWAQLIKLRRPAIAGYLDRAEIVSRVSDHRLRVASGDSWGEPLGDMAGRVLSEDLSQRLRGSVVFMETSPISASPDAVVSVDIQRFDVGNDGAVTLRAEIAVERSSDHSVVGIRNIELHLRPSATDTASLVAAMSDLLAQLAGQIIPFLLDTQGAEPPPHAVARVLQTPSP
jgi:uncharacterized lipoprotein YmbA